MLVMYDEITSCRRDWHLCYYNRQLQEISAVQGTRQMRRPSIVDEVVVAPAQAEAAVFPACAEAVSR